MLYPMRVLKELGKSGDGLVELGRNPHRTLRRWWGTSELLVEHYPELAALLLGHLGQRLNSGPTRPVPPGAVAVRLVSLAASALSRSSECGHPKGMLRMETVLNDLSVLAARGAGWLRSELDGDGCD